MRSEVWIIVKGKGILTIDGVDSIVSEGSVIQIPVGVKHSLLAATEFSLRGLKTPLQMQRVNFFFL